MSRQGQRPGMPVVNLLSPSSFEVIAARRLRRRFLAGAFALVVLVAGLWTAQHLRIEETRKLVAVEQAETTRLNGETQLLLPVRTFVTGVEAQKTTIEKTMAREIYFSEVLDGIQRSTPVGATLESLAVTLAPNPAATAATTPAVPAVSPCPGPDPFHTRTVVGCVVLAGTASSRADVGALVIALAKVKLFVEPFISTTVTADGANVSFAGSVGLSQAVFSKRYGNPIGTGDPR